ncbi:MAG TPA: hypothetical protein VH044_15630 [Polyangiaceae bacterium]|nr:hypothetical protein [Polyangiaceae bacterium]
MRSRRHTLAATALLVFVAAAPIALAAQGAEPTLQGDSTSGNSTSGDSTSGNSTSGESNRGDSKAKKKKPKAAPADSASASASASATPAEEPTPSATAAPEPAPTETTTPPEAGTVSAAPAEDEDDITNVWEDPGKTHVFIGLRYRGTIVPSFLEHLFVKDGATIYSNTIGAEVDFRKGANSLIVSLGYTEYSFGDTLFLQKGVDDTMANNYTIVSSGLKGIYAGIDDLWSSPLVNHLDLEYGFGLGLGAIFGNLYNDWAWSPSDSMMSVPGQLTGSNGKTYAKCNSQTDGTPAGICTTGAHKNADTAKVGNYVEPNWFNGGAVPVIFPRIVGTIGLRYKPIRQLETRLDIGISLTEGFYFGISGDYGLTDDHPHSKTSPASTAPAPEKSPASETSSNDKN